MAMEAKKWEVQKKLVVLFKAPKNEGRDQFKEVLENAGFQLRLIPVLSFNFINLESLSEKVADERYLGVIFTSATSVEAVTRASALPGGTGARSRLAGLRCFVVGPSTASAARAAGFQLISGEESGQAENLGAVIVRELTDTKGPLLFPCGNLRRDVIPNYLKEKGLEVDEITVYETGPNPRVEQETAKVLKNGLPEYIVYFSPSGIDNTRFLFAEVGVPPPDQLKIIALGPATKRKLIENKISVCGVPESPTPAGLLQLLESRPKEQPGK